jgi:hypothetical protein
VAAPVITEKSRLWPMRPAKPDCNFNLNQQEYCG